MEFFDKKEEVLDIELTEYGRTLLSAGRWKPEYYAFFDDDILYDSEAGGLIEKQNDARRRIKYNTPSLKTQPYILGAETRVTRFIGEVTGSDPAAWTTVTDNSVSFVDAFQEAPHFDETFFAASDPIGTSALRAEYAPAWAISMVTNEISSSQPQVGMTLINQNVSLTGSHTGLVIQDIPQIDIDVDYKTFYHPTDPDYQGFKYIPLTPQLNAEGIQLFVEDDFLIVEILENNTDYIKENFNIEVFKTTYDAYTDPNYKIIGHMASSKQLTFINEGEIYHFPEEDRDVEYYLNILVDNEMPPQVADNLGISEHVIRASSVRLALSRDLYGDTEAEEGCD
tara:strand:+ start:3314 stop:4330 length:1017 start_codon:yes stop_codon:yes gene_type:complete